jgi:hypothetical protein
VDRNDFLRLQGGENPLHNTAFRPTIKFLVYRFPFSELRGQGSPLAAVFGDVQDCVDKVAIVDLDIAACASVIFI